MDTLITIAVVLFVALAIITGYSLCRISGVSDEEMEQAFLEMIQEEENEQAS